MAVITRAASSATKQSTSKRCASSSSSALAAPERAAPAKKAESTSSSFPSAAARPASSSQRRRKEKAQAHDDPAHVTRTSDGHFIVVNNRKWRATDPLIPEAELAQLKHHLAKGRSGTRVAKGKGKEEADAAVKCARRRTGIAKHGLGERGKPEWWNDSEEGRRTRWEDALKELEELAEDDV